MGRRIQSAGKERITFRQVSDEARELDAALGAVIVHLMRPSAIFVLSAVLSFTVLPSCKPKTGVSSESPPPLPPTRGPLPGTDPRPLTPARREAVVEFAQSFAAQLNAGQFDAIARDLDLNQMMEIAFGGIQWEENPKWTDFRNSLVQRLRANPAQLFAALQDVRAVFLRLHETPSGTAALVRCLLPNGAVTYFDVFARFDETTGTASLANIYNHATGLDVPDSLRAILFALAPAADRTLADRLFGVDKTADPAVMTAFDTALRQRNPAAVAAAWPQLPSSLRAQRPVLMAALQVLMLEPQAPAYLTTLEEARTLYAHEPLADLLSIDLHFLQNDPSALEKCLDRVEQSLGGPDAHLATLRASSRLAAGNDAGAELAVDIALSMEPDFINALLTRLKILITRREFAAATAELASMHEKFGQVFTPPPASRGPAFADFLNSPEYSQWIALHPPPVPSSSTSTPSEPSEEPPSPPSESTPESTPETSPESEITPELELDSTPEADSTSELEPTSEPTAAAATEAETATPDAPARD